MSTNVMVLDWCFGYSKDIPLGVHSLFTERRNALVYSAAHTVVIYDLSTQRQELLQGHCNPISCLCVSRDREWIFTADSGPDSMVIVWKADTGVPMKNIFNPHPGGVVSMDLSPDSRILATLSAYNGPKVPSRSPPPIPPAPSSHARRRAAEGTLTGSAGPGTVGLATAADAASLSGEEGTAAGGEAPPPGAEELALWNWTAPQPTALVRAPLQTRDAQVFVRFNTGTVNELVTTGTRRVVFWTWDMGQVRRPRPACLAHGLRMDRVDGPSLNPKELHQSVGALTQSVFLPPTRQAVTATVDGDLILWDSSPVSHGVAAKTTDRKVVKVLNRSNAITALLVHDNFLITGDQRGHFQLVNWFEELNGGPIVSLSVCTPPKDTAGDELDLALARPRELDPWKETEAIEFVAATGHAKVLLVRGNDPPAILREGEGKAPPAAPADEPRGPSRLDCHAPDPAPLRTRGHIRRGGGTVMLYDMTKSCPSPYLMPIIALALPCLALPCLVGGAGTVMLYDIGDGRHELIAQRNFDKPAYCAKFDPTGRQLAVVGFRNSMDVIWAEDPPSEPQKHVLDTHWPFRNNSDVITHIAFAPPDGPYFATASADRYVALYRRRVPGEARRGGMTELPLPALTNRAPQPARRTIPGTPGRIYVPQPAGSPPDSSFQPFGVS
ncbi:putative Malonyl-CoA decarboxylase [Paratrimastix pyriformis]|uniref:Cilia- and flagella-associated protein 251 n=1 Tax=Paratrimastix pyriformis TaxID=342808 RepID=A0ABQ8U6I6_9EUKA|nr:putative Malonyl-CoA decarboxylase [Paratrimastix pyriformis]